MDRTTTRAGVAAAIAVAFFLSLAGSSIKSTVQVFFAPMAADFGVTAADFAWATTLFAITIAVASPLVGALADRIGAAPTLTLGAAIASLALFVCALTETLAVFVVAFGSAAAAAYTMLSYVPLAVLVDEAYRNRSKGFAYAVVTNGTAVGFIVLVPLWVWWGEEAGWRLVLGGVAAAFAVIGVPAGLWLARRLRVLASTLPDGVTAPAPASSSSVPSAAGESTASSVSAPPAAGVSPAASASAPPAAEEPPPATAEMPLTPRRSGGVIADAATLLRNRRYGLLMLAFLGCGVTMTFVDVHLVAHLHHEGTGSGEISGTIALLGFLEIIGALLAGRLCDGGWTSTVLIGGYLLRGLAMLALLLPGVTGSTMIFAALFGLSYMAVVIATTLLASEALPEGTRGLGLGAMWTLHGLGAAAASQLGALSATMSQGYTTAIAGSAALVFVSAGLSALAVSRTGPVRSQRG